MVLREAFLDVILLTRKVIHLIQFLFIVQMASFKNRVQYVSSIFNVSQFRLNVSFFFQYKRN